MSTKHCRKCDMFKPVTEFGNDKSRPDGKFPWCKVCKRVSNAEYRSENGEKIAEGQRRCYEAKPEQYAETRRRWREANRERKAHTDAEYYAQNRERILAYTQEWKVKREGNRPADKPWPQAACGYAAAHDRVKAVRGRASWHACIDCNGSAAEWSYRGGSDRETAEWGFNPRGEPILRPYSLEPDDYDPRCVSCHRKYDANTEREAIPA